MHGMFDCSLYLEVPGPAAQGRETKVGSGLSDNLLWSGLSEDNMAIHSAPQNTVTYWTQDTRTEDGYLYGSYLC